MTTRHIENRLAEIDNLLADAIRDSAERHHEIATATGLLATITERHNAHQQRLAAIQEAVQALREAIREPA